MPSVRSKQTAVMAGIVTTILGLPFGALLALFCYAVFGIPLEAFLTFGHALPHPGLGLPAWWAIFFAPAYFYAVVISSHD